MVIQKYVYWSLKIFKPFSRIIGLSFVFDLLALCFSLLFVWYSKQAIDVAVDQHSGHLNKFLFLTFICLISSFAFAQLASYLAERTKAKMLSYLQVTIMQKQMSIRWFESQNRTTGDIMQRIITDCQELLQVVCSVFPALILNFVRVISAGMFLFWMDSSLAMLLLGMMPLFLISKTFFRKLRRMNADLKLAESGFGQSLQENIRLRLLIRSFNQTRSKLRTLMDDSQAIYLKKIGVLNFSCFSKASIAMVFNMGYMLAFAWGVIDLNKGGISFGTLSAFLQLVARIQGPIVALMANIPALVRFSNAADRIQELLDDPVEEDYTDHKLATIQELEVQQISLRAKNTRLLDNLSFSFKKGEASIILGATGLGKSTFLRLILGLIPSDEGRVKLKEIDEEHLMGIKFRCNFSYVPQGEKIFHASILANLQTGCGSHSEVALRNALQVACANFVYELPQGLQTIVGESGFGLSEGQIQRLAIARAILQDSRIWIFDEITSALDQDTSHQLVKNIVSAGKEKIILFVSHDRSLTPYFSQIISLD